MIKITLKIICLKTVFVVLLSSFLLNAQTKFINHSDSTNILCNKPTIKFITVITSDSLNNYNSSLLNTIYDFFIGKDKLNIIKPVSVIKSKEGSILFADNDAKSIIRYSPEKKIAENILEDFNLLESPIDLCEYEDGLLFTDSKLNKIFNYDFKSKKISEFYSSLNQPTGITYLKNKNEFWVCDTKNHQIIRIDKTGKLLGIIGKRGKDKSEFNFPIFIWSDGKGKVYINDSMNFRIQIFSENGEFINEFGSAGDGSGNFARPKGIATDSYDNIYVVDALFNNVQIFDQTGRLLFILGDQGTDLGKFWLPSGIYIDNQNFIYISDSFNSRIQVFKLISEN